MDFGEINAYINDKKEIQEIILNIVENDIDTDEYNCNLNELSTLLQTQDFSKYPEELKMLIYIISKITKNHHRQKDFFKKIEQILNLIQNDIKNTYSNFEIFYFFKNNLRMILLLFQTNILNAEESIYKYITNKERNKSEQSYFGFREKQKQILYLIPLS